MRLFSNQVHRIRILILTEIQLSCIGEIYVGTPNTMTFAKSSKRAFALPCHRMSFDDQSKGGQQVRQRRVRTVQVAPRTRERILPTSKTSP